MPPQTSIDAYNVIRDNIRDQHWELLVWMCENHRRTDFTRPWTAREIEEMSAGRLSFNEAHRRLREMARGRLVVCLPPVKCRVSGRDAFQWQLPATIPPPEVAVLASKGVSAKRVKTWAIERLRQLRQQMLAVDSPGEFVAAVVAVAEALHTEQIPIGGGESLE